MHTSTTCLRNFSPNDCSNLIPQKQLRPQLPLWKQRLQRWHINWRTRRQLVQLDRYQLKDIGVTLDEAVAEASKPFWKD